MGRSARKTHHAHQANPRVAQAIAAGLITGAIFGGLLLAIIIAVVRQ